MVWTSAQYEKNVSRYGKKDGLKGIAVYVFVLASCFFQGWTYTTNWSSSVLNALQVWMPLLMVVIFLGYMFIAKEKLSTIGIHSSRLRQSIILGIAGGITLRVILSLLFMMKGSGVALIPPFLTESVIFIISGFEEEVLFRGFIQTRLYGLIRNRWLAGAINAVLFLSIHYPVKWVLSGDISFSVLPLIYIVALISLHYFCDAVYKKTNSLWGSVILHIIYNIVGAVIVYS